MENRQYGGEKMESSSQRKKLQIPNTITSSWTSNLLNYERSISVV